MRRGKRRSVGMVLLVPMLLVPLALLRRAVPLRRRVRWLGVGAAAALVVIAPWVGYTSGPPSATPYSFLLQFPVRRAALFGELRLGLLRARHWVLLHPLL